MTEVSVDERLKSFLERIERLDEEKQGLMDDIKEVFSEAKANGYDPKIMKKVLRLRKMDREKRREEESLTEVYKAAVGMD